MADKCGGQGYLFLAAAAKDCVVTWITNHNKAASRDWSVSLRVSKSRHQAMPVGHIGGYTFSQRLVPTLWCKQFTGDVTEVHLLYICTTTHIKQQIPMQTKIVLICIYLLSSTVYLLLSINHPLTTCQQANVNGQASEILSSAVKSTNNSFATSLFAGAKFTPTN